MDEAAVPGARSRPQRALATIPAPGAATTTPSPRCDAAPPTASASCCSAPASAPSISTIASTRTTAKLAPLGRAIVRRGQRHLPGNDGVRRRLAHHRHRQRTGGAPQVHLRPQDRRRHRALPQHRALYHRVRAWKSAHCAELPPLDDFIDKLLARLQHGQGDGRSISTTPARKRATIDYDALIQNGAPRRRAQRTFPGGGLAPGRPGPVGRADHRRAGASIPTASAPNTPTGCTPR